MNIDIAKQEFEEELTNCIAKKHLNIILHNVDRFFKEINEKSDRLNNFNSCTDNNIVLYVKNQYINLLMCDKQFNLSRFMICDYLLQYQELPIMNLNKIYSKYCNLLNLTYENAFNKLEERAQNKIDSFLMKN